MRRVDIQLLTFGFLLTFFSSFGQTFFIGLFSADMRAAVGLGDGAFGTLYSTATAASAAAVFWAGGLVDRVALRPYAAAAAVLLASGCILLTLSEHVVWLGIALFLLRFAGQGLLTHTAVTTMARYFTAARGRALSTALLGHPAGEALLPLAAVAIAAGAGWQRVWLLAAGLTLATLPLLMWLSAKRPRLARVEATSGAARRPSEHNALFASADNAPSHDATRREVVRDRRFHLLLPTVLLPPFVITGVFIHQTRLVAEQGWTLSWFAGAFVVYAAAQVAGMLGAGPLIDRFSARRLALLYLLPLTAACISIGLIDHRLAAWAFMAGAGLSAGIGAPTSTALWAELYGITHLGAIRAMGVTLLIAATAVAPALFGWLLEAGVSFETILFSCAAAGVASALLARAALLGRRRQAR